MAVASGESEPEKQASEGSGRGSGTGIEVGGRPRNPIGLDPAKGGEKSEALRHVQRTEEAVVGTAGNGRCGQIDRKDDSDDVEERVLPTRQKAIDGRLRAAPEASQTARSNWSTALSGGLNAPRTTIPGILSHARHP